MSLLIRTAIYQHIEGDPLHIRFYERLDECPDENNQFLKYSIRVNKLCVYIL
jgi:hypothetical protein